jgi:hypothetical protein
MIAPRNQILRTNSYRRDAEIAEITAQSAVFTIFTRASFPRSVAEEHQQFEIPSIAIVPSATNARKTFFLSPAPVANFLRAVRGEVAFT